MTAWLAGYGAALLVLGVLDGLWLGFVMRDFYRREIGPMMVDSVRLLPAALFYFGYPAGMMALVLSPMPTDFGTVLWKSALVGLMAYGVYDLSNMATLRPWTWKLVVTDIVWGTALTAAAGTAAWWAMRWVGGR